MSACVLLGTLLLALGSQGQEQEVQHLDCRLSNTDGCTMVRDPTYLVLAPRKVRPNQLINVFTTVLKLEYKELEIVVSVIKGEVQYADTKVTFDRTGSRVLQMLTPSSMTPGQYKLRVIGSLGGTSTGFIFKNETDIEFGEKSVSVFIQLSKPIYRMGQTVHFRVIPILPNLIMHHGSMTIFVMDPSGFAVRRWLGQQTNAGGFVNQSFALSDQPTYGTWNIEVRAFGYTYRKSFEVIEFWEPRYDINVTVPPYIMGDADGIRGVVNANHTSGRPVIGNATLTVTIVPPGGEYNWKNPFYFPTIERKIEYFVGRIDMYFSRDELLDKANAQSLENMEFFFNVTTYDWYLSWERSGFGSTFCYNSGIVVKWVGDRVRTFKPGSVFVATVAIMHADGTAVSDETRGITVVPTISTTGEASGRMEPITKLPINGLATFAFETFLEDMEVTLTATYQAEIPTHPVQLKAYRYYSPSHSYVSVTTSTRNPKVNQYIIFHVKSSIYVPKIYYQIVSQGNILIGDELEMISRQKTFSIALSRDMVPSARIIVFYIRQPEEIVVDALNFFVNGTRLNPVAVRFNRGKDFTRHTVEVNAFSDPGSFAAFSALPYDLYVRGLNDGISENLVIDELLTYDMPANGSYLHKWRINENEYQYKFYSSNGYGIDANRTFWHAGLTVLTDADVTTLGISCEETGQFTCFDGQSCYSNDTRCNGVYDCPNDWGDEQGCTYDDKSTHNPRRPLDRISHVMRFYDDSSWIWREKFVKPDGRIDFRVNVPRYPLTWVVNGFSSSQNKGLGILERPVRFDATRLMYIQVEAPIYVVRGEQVGFRVTVFNYWYTDDYLEVLVKVHGSPNYKFVHVQPFGIVDFYDPLTTGGDHETIVFLEPGESKDIYMPVVPVRWENEHVDVTISATCYLASDVVTKRLHVQYDGITNYYSTPYLVDLITKSSVVIPDLKVNVPQSFILPEQREHEYVPGSPKAIVSVFGDVVIPGFFEEYPTAEDILRRPYGSAEQNMFNFAYNLLTLKFKKNSKQLSDPVLMRTLEYMNVGLQRQLSYMTPEGGVKMFRDDTEASTWLTAFVVKTLDEARFAEWEQTLFIPADLINSLVIWLCNKQNDTGAFHEAKGSPVYDRKMASINEQTIELYNDPIPLTAYVLIALQKVTGASKSAQTCSETSRRRAATYLRNQVLNIDVANDVFHLAITTYALSLTEEESRTAYDILYKRGTTQEKQLYWADRFVPSNPSRIQSALPLMLPRFELQNDAYSVHSTAYALMSLIRHGGLRYDLMSTVTWLNNMRNFIGGFASTQDTIVAMEALMEFAQVDTHRNVFDMLLSVESTANPAWKAFSYLSKYNYTTLQMHSLPSVWGWVKVKAHGVGRAMLQLSVSENVEYPWKVKPPNITTFDLMVDRMDWGGRNNSVLELTVCTRWLLLQKSVHSGLAVMEIEIPTGFVVMNDTLRSYVQSKAIPTLRRAESYYRKVVYYFDYIDTSKTCIRFRADRWYPVANGTLQHQMRIYDYYEPGLHNTTMYFTQDLASQNLCWACASFQCPYCPYFNAAVVIRSGLTILSLLTTLVTSLCLLYM
ncbi:CD109 antigen-like [Liolophura sinensis]|uniref:CD109 antigen-like n=1 Tax=Liolophura sinensis TaxID=3198878 RepID=UPI003158F5AE